MEYFKDSEFQCKCGECGKNINDMDKELLFMLDKARGVAEVPFVITSSIRCAKHNKAVGGVATSSHLSGNAVDIAIDNDLMRAKVTSGLVKAGFRRIGVASNFIHADNDSTKNSSIWKY